MEHEQTTQALKKNDHIDSNSNKQYRHCKNFVLMCFLLDPAFPACYKARIVGRTSLFRYSVNPQ
jgi:hypothetical protein